MHKFILASILVALAAGFVGSILVRLFKFPLSNHSPIKTFSLIGSVGLPVCLFFHGDEALAYGLVFFTVTSVGTFRGDGMISKGNPSFDKVTREPFIWILILAVFLIWSGFSLPRWIIDTTWLLGAIAIPLQLIVLGSFLEWSKPKFFYRTVIFSVVQLCIGFILGFLVSKFFSFGMPAQAVLILLASMPVAKSNYVFATIFRCEPTDVSGMVFVSTITSVLAFPLILGWLLNIS